jgi:hypothetical protein
VKRLIIFYFLLPASALALLNEGIYRVSSREEVKLQANIHNSRKLHLLKPINGKLAIYQPNENTPFLQSSEFKQKHLRFVKTEKVIEGSSLNFNAVILTNTLIQRVKDSLSKKDLNSVSQALSSMEQKEWKKLIIGSSSKDKLRFAGLAEQKRRWESVDEHMDIFLNPEYQNSPFEKKYFIPTGYIDIGDGLFVSVNELVNNAIEINIPQAKVKILKSVVLYSLEEVLEDPKFALIKGPVSKEFNHILSCTRNCQLNKEADFGGRVIGIIELLEEKSMELETKLKKLKRELLSICTGGENVIEKTREIDNESLSKFNAYALYHPDINIEDYLNLSPANLTPEEAILYLLKVKEGKLKLEIYEALAFKKKWGKPISTAYIERLSLDSGIPFYLEELEKNSFVGPSANTFAKLLAAPGFSRDHISIASSIFRKYKESFKKNHLDLDSFFNHLESESTGSVLIDWNTMIEKEARRILKID